MSSSAPNNTIPPPDSQVVSLVAALSNTANHDLHVQAIHARDQALGASMESYSNLCVQLARLLGNSQQDDVHFAQLAGLILKQALLTPPNDVLHLVSPSSDQVKEILLIVLNHPSKELRAVASSVIATAAVSDVQPAMTIQSWPQLLPTLVQNMDQPLGHLMTIQKMMEDGAHGIPQVQLDVLIPRLIHFLNPQFTQEQKMSALQSIAACLDDGIMPNALVVGFDEYLAGLSALATDPSPQVRKWVCRSIVTLLLLRTEYIQPHMGAMSQFMLNSTADVPEVALEACEFWLTYTTLDEECITPDMHKVVESLLPQLLPLLLRGIVYSREEQEEIQYRNQAQLEEAEENRPVFHKTRNKHGGGNDSDDDDDDNDDFDDDDGNEWSLRKCSAASLDSLASMYGPQPILPSLLPLLQQGLRSNDAWTQEASVLALGAISDGCRLAMYPHMAQLHPYLMMLLTAPSESTLPQVKSIAAWTIGRYASWAVEQVQSGAQGHLLAIMTEALMAGLDDKNRRVQVACCSAFGVMVEAAGDLMVPYLEPIYTHLARAMGRFQTRTVLVVFDALGVMADFIGPAIGEGALPGIYIPPLLHLWSETAKHNPADRTLLPLMESLASIALVCGVNYQPFALETFDSCMCTIESVTLILTSSGDYIDDDQDADPIICSADLLDGLVEGLGANFPALVSSSTRYGPHFTNVLYALVKHEVPGVRMSAFALLGDLAVKSPAILEPALPQLLKEGIQCLDPIHPSVCNNAVWAIGEVCVRCGDNPAPLEPFAAPLVQKMMALFMGNGAADGQGGGVAIVGVTENAAAAMGRLAKVNPNFVAADLPRFLVGWCDGIAKVSDPNERRDAFQGFVLALHANPQAIQTASANVADTVTAILFAIVSWHMPMDGQVPVGDLLHSDYRFEPFPPNETELQNSLGKLMHDLKTSVGDETWTGVYQQVPVNVRRLLRETYHL